MLVAAMVLCVPSGPMLHAVASRTFLWAESPLPSDTQLARLAGLGRLWGYIKHTHPWMAQRTKEWDHALVVAIPKVKSAASAEEYAHAVDHMLSALGDPATRRTIGNTRPWDAVARVPPPARPQPSIEWTRADTAVITASDYAAIDSSPTGRGDLARLLAEAAKAKTVILDIRRLRDAKNAGRIGAAVSAALTNTMGRLVKDSVPLPPTRYVYHQGYAPQTGPYPSYYSGLLTIAGGEFRIQAASTPRPAHLVFIVNAGSTDLYSVLTGLQDQGVASVVQEGDPNPDAGVMFTYTRGALELPDGMTLQIRRGEIVRANGVPGFQPDTIAPPPADSESDPARKAAMELAEKGPAQRVNPTGQSQPQFSFGDDAYPQSNYPSEEYRLLGLFRFWSSIEYFFPYKELMDQPWDTALSDFIPRMQQARDATEYALAVAELVTRLQDSHVAISSPAFASYMGTHRPPVRLDPVEGQLVVTGIDDPAKRAADLQIGDVVLAVDHEDIAKRRERLTKYLPASTPGALHSSHAREVLRGAKDSEVIIKVKPRQGEVKEVRLTRSVMGATRSVAPQKLPVYTVLPDGFGYVDMDRLTHEQAREAYAAVRDTPGLVVDLRGYIDSGSREFIGALVRKANLPALMISRMQYDGMAGQFMKNTVLQPSYTQPAAAPYQGKLVVLTSTATVSAAESACMTLASIGRDVTFIGAPTTGANGNVTNATFPGNIAIRFTGMEIRYPDGRQLQRRGIQPDIEVHPTIESVALGRDQVLERAVAFLKGDQR